MCMRLARLRSSAFVILPLFVALLALATRYYSTHGNLDFVDDGENYVVDLGYQLNLGAIVAVS